MSMRRTIMPHHLVEVFDRSLRNLARPALVAVSIVGASIAAAQEPEAEPPTGAEHAVSLDDLLGADSAAEGEESKSDFLKSLGENLRLNFDFVSRVEITSKRGEAAFLNTVGVDIHKVFSDDEGDIGTLLLQLYVVRRDNQYSRFFRMNNDDAFVIELHDFYFNLTRFGRGQRNLKIGHFDVPFGLEPNEDTHFTLRQFIPLHDAGFKKDWGVSLNGSPPDFDYEVSLTRGTGRDLNDHGHDTYLVAGRIGTPADENFTVGLAAFYGEVHDRHGTHRVDEADPRGKGIRESEEWVRRWRVGGDATWILGQFTLRSEMSGGQDFDQDVANVLGEVMWTTPDEAFSAYLQGIYLGQDGFLGWSEDIKSRLGLVWNIDERITVSAQWIHEFQTHVNVERGPHSHEDSYTLQFRVRF